MSKNVLNMTQILSLFVSFKFFLSLYRSSVMLTFRKRRFADSSQQTRRFCGFWKRAIFPIDKSCPGKIASSRLLRDVRGYISSSKNVTCLPLEAITSRKLRRSIFFASLMLSKYSRRKFNVKYSCSVHNSLRYCECNFPCIKILSSQSLKQDFSFISIFTCIFLYFRGLICCELFNGFQVQWLIIIYSIC